MLLSNNCLFGAGVLLAACALVVVVGACDGRSSSAAVPDSARMSLEEYAAECAKYADDEIPSHATNGEVSQQLARSIELMESIIPPAEVADYHSDTLALGKALKLLIDVQPEDEMANPFAFLTLLPLMQSVEDSMNDLEPEVRRTLAAVGCAQAMASVAESGGPSALAFDVEGPANRVTWTPVQGAEFYKVYFGNVPDCYVNPTGDASGCDELASNVAGTTHLHEEPHRDLNYYWVSACDAQGCSFVHSDNWARFVGETPEPPEGPRYEREGASAILSWAPSEGATHYKIYFDVFENRRCSISSIGLALGCEQLDGNATETDYVHTGVGSTPSYWVVACNRGGCSEIDSADSAQPIVSSPASPANAVYVMEGTKIRLTWDAVSEAAFYRIYHDDVFDSGCRLGYDGSPSFCDELATNVAATSYVHSNPSARENHYWIVACNKGGCSAIDSDNPVSDGS